MSRRGRVRKVEHMYVVAAPLSPIGQRPLRRRFGRRPRTSLSQPVQPVKTEVHPHRTLPRTFLGFWENKRQRSAPKFRSAAFCRARHPPDPPLSRLERPATVGAMGSIVKRHGDWRRA